MADVDNPPLPKGFQSVETTPTLPNGYSSVTSQHTQTPPSPNYTQKINTISKGGLSQQEKDQLNSALTAFAQNHGGKIITNVPNNDKLEVPDKESDRQARMLETTRGKIAGSVLYLASKASHGATDILRGAAHLLPYVQGSEDKMFDKLDKASDLGLTPTAINTMEGSKYSAPLKAAGMMAEFAPAALGGEAAELPRTAMFLQGVGQGKSTADKLDIKNPYAKEALIMGSGVTNLLLTDVFHGAKIPSAVQSDVVSGITMDALKDAAGKDLSTTEFKNLLNGKAQAFAQKFEQAPVEAMSHYLETAKTFTKLNLANFGLHKAVNELEGKQVFGDNLGGLAGQEMKSLTQDAPLFSALPAIGALSKLTPYSGYQNDAYERLMNDPNSAEQLKGDIAHHAQLQGWSPEETQSTLDHIDKVADAAKTLPRTIAPEKKADALGLVLNRNELQDKLDQSKQQSTDPALADVQTKQQDYLQNKIDQANEKLRNIVTGEKTTYSKGIGKDEGKFFKITNGVREEISPSRYELENLERTSKQQQNESKNTGRKSGLPTESQERPETRETIRDEEHAVQHFGNEDDEGRKDLNTEVEGGDEPPLKPRYTIKSEEVKPKEDATKTGEVTENGEQEHIGTPQGKNVQQDGEEVRQEKGGQAGGSNSVEPSEEKPLTGIRNEDVATERNEDVPREAKTFKEIDTEGKRLVDSGEVNPDELAKKVVDGKRAVSAEEEAALLYHKTRLNNRQNAILSDTNPENNLSNQAEYAKNEELLEQNRKATEIAGNVAGRSLAYRRQLMEQDYSLATLLRRAKLFNGGVDVSPEVKAKLEQHSKRIAELEKQAEAREEQIRRLQEKSVVSEVRNQDERDARKEKREITKSKLRKEREDLVAELHTIARKSMKSAGANKLPVEMIAPLAKLARNYVLDGINTIGAVADKIYNEHIKDKIPNIDRDDVEAAIKDGFDKFLLEKNAERLAGAKKRAQTKLEQMKEGNYEKRTYAKIQVDNDYLKIRAEINREQQKINKRMDDIMNSQKSIGRKAADFAVKYGRQAKLASVTVLGKLAAAGLSTVGLKPVTEAIGGGLSKLLPRIAAKSTIEGGTDFKGMAKSYAKAATQGMKDAYDEMNIRAGGKSDLSALYGKAGQLPAEAAEFFGHVHSAIKAPIKRFIFEQSYAKRIAKQMKVGLDITDPVIDAQNRLAAYKDAQRAIFMGDNALSEAYENVVGKFEKTTDSKSGLSIRKNSAAIARILLPFVKVPTNIVLSTGRYAFGLVPGLGKLAQVGTAEAAKRVGAEKIATMLGNGIEGMKPEDADLVLRNLKHGSIGAAALALGYYNPKAVGGYYQQGEKRKSNEVGADQFKVFGTKIPMWLTEHPIFQVMQIGATYRRLTDKHMNKPDSELAPVLGTLSGISENVPLASEAKTIFDALGSSNKFTKFTSNIIKGEIEPAALQQLAQITDTKDGSTFNFDTKNQNKRKPNSKHGLGRYLKEDLETGVPGLRGNVHKSN